MKSGSERYAALVRLVESRTVTRVSPPLLLPAGPFFDLAGEEFGRNLLLTTANAEGQIKLAGEAVIALT